MRSGAFRRGIALLALLVVMGGCSSATKKHYLRHLSATIPQVGVDVEITAADPSSSEVVAAPTNEPRP